MSKLRVAVHIIGCAGLLIAAGSCGAPREAESTRRARPAKPPNVLFIAVDDLNDWTGCLRGHPQASTPNIDRLASQGVTFTNAHCPAPLCTPSRVSVFTGLHPFHTGVYSNGDRLEDVRQDLLSLPAHFKAHGYKTLTGGKTFPVGGEYSRSGWSVKGPESTVRGSQGGPFTKEEYDRRGKPPHYLVERLGVTRPLSGMIDQRKHHAGGSFDWGGFDLPDDAFGDGVVADWARQQLEELGDEPFFLAVGFFRPHIPLYAPQRYFDDFPAASTSLPETKPDDLADVPEVARFFAISDATAGLHSQVLEHGQWNNAVAAYLACVKYADAQVGKVLNALENGGHAGNTIVVLWSDHGWHLGEKEHWGKSTGWERATRVPLIISLPAGIRTGSLTAAFRPGTRLGATASLTDLFPTVVDLAGLPEVQGLDGRNLVPVLTAGGKADDGTATVTFGRGNYTVVQGAWRYIHYFDGSEELYNAAEDPGQFTNLAQDPGYRSRLDALREHVPDVPELAYCARYNNYKAVVFRDSERPALLFDLTLEQGVTDRGDIAAEQPRIVDIVRSYAAGSKITERYFAVPGDR